MVTRSYIEELQKKAAAAERSGASDHSGRRYSDIGNDSIDVESSPPDGHARSCSHDPSERVPLPSRAEVEDPASPISDRGATNLTNPLSTGQSSFVTTADGITLYLGTSSDWSFTRRILSMTHEHLYHAPLPPRGLIFEGSAYDLEWKGSRRAPRPPSPVLPTLDYTIFLINAVKFHCGQLFHLFDEELFMRSLYTFYENPDLSPRNDEEELWYVHFLLILSFGKAFTCRTAQGRRPPGSEFFCKALYELPDVISLWIRPVEAVEVLCCIGLYLQCVDYRLAAYNYIGQAMRITLGQGLHTDMPVDCLGYHTVERARRAWWTVYVLDREMTSLLGLPQSIHDEDVHPQAPSFSGSVQRSKAFSMQINLSRVVANINRTVYGADGKLDRRFLQSTKSALADIAQVADKLRRWFPIRLENTISGVSRTSAHLHLMYHQCIVLATRPLLFCFLKIRLESAEACSAKLDASKTVRNLIQMCLDSSFQIIMILDSLQSQGLLEIFLPFDLGSLFISTSNSIIGRALDSQLLGNVEQCLKKAYALYDEFVTVGNQIALHQKAELLQLNDMLNSLTPERDLLGPIPGNSGNIGPGLVTIIHPTPVSTMLASEDAAASEILTSMSVNTAVNEETFGSLMTSAQVLGMANSIDNMDTEWMSQAMLEHSIW